MIRQDRNAMFRILGVFRIVREKGGAENRSRDFATLAYRVRGNSRFFCAGREFSAGSHLFSPDQRRRGGDLRDPPAVRGRFSP